ncbi:SEL1 protein [Nematocida sp. AWRm80]|nr:SEL1 protein [Nematocida sp. AWRm80]
MNLLINLLLQCIVLIGGTKVFDCECNEVFKELFLETNTNQALKKIDTINSNCKYLYSYFINYYRIDNNDSTSKTYKSIKDLILSEDTTCKCNILSKLIIGNRIENNYNLAGEVKEVSEYYKKVAEEVFNEYFKKKVSLFAKWEFEHLEKEKENKQIIEFIKTLTSGGDINATDNLLSLIKIGHVDAINNLEFLKECARNGKEEALGMLGNIYYYGWGVPVSKIKARHYFSEGSKKNDPDSLNGLGMIYLDEGNEKEGTLLLEKASSYESASADYNLYKLYAETKGFLSQLHLIKAAKQKGYLPAVYRHGEQAFNRKEYRSSISQFKSICAYHDTVLKIEALALEQYKQKKYFSSLLLSILIGDLGIATGYKNALFILTKKNVPVSDTLTVQIAKRMVDLGDTSSSITLGNIYYTGTKSIPMDRDKAFSKYLLSALQDTPEGNYLTGWMYEYGIGTTKDYSLSKAYYHHMYLLNGNSYILYYILVLRLFYKQYYLYINSIVILILLYHCTKHSIGIFSRVLIRATANKNKIPKTNTTEDSEETNPEEKPNNPNNPNEEEISNEEEVFPQSIPE